MAERGKLSNRGLAMPSSPIRRLAPLAVAARAAGKKVYQLNIGQPDIATPKEMLDRLRNYAEDNVAYGPSEGLPEFIDTLVKYHARCGLEVAPEQIFVTTGGSEALLFSFAAVADPGDEVIVFEPFYTNYSGFSDLVGVTCVPVTTHAETGYHLPAREEIEAKITDRVKALVICSPNNPTGTVYSREEMEMIADIVREHGLFLISDEVYREFTYDGLEAISAFDLPGISEQVILTDSLSKRASLCGARVGWIVSRNAQFIETVLKFGQARLCPPTLGQVVGIGLNDIPADYMPKVIAEYQGRRDTVYEALVKAPGVTLQRPEGAFYLCAKIPVDDAQRFAEFLLNEFDVDGETVMVAPADGFYATPGMGKDEVRIAYVLNEGDLKKAMHIFTSALAVYPGRKSAS